MITVGFRVSGFGFRVSGLGLRPKSWYHPLPCGFSVRFVLGPRYLLNWCTCSMYQQVGLKPDCAYLQCSCGLFLLFHASNEVLVSLIDEPYRNFLPFRLPKGIRSPLTISLSKVKQIFLLIQMFIETDNNFMLPEQREGRPHPSACTTLIQKGPSLVPFANLLGGDTCNAFLCIYNTHSRRFNEYDFQVRSQWR